MEEENGVFYFEGREIAVWMDGCICIKTRNKYNDPIELSDEEAIDLANLLIRLAS